MLGQLDWDGVVLPIDEVTWTNVLDTAERLQGLEINEDFFVTYKDEEGDVINVKNETDLTEAIRWAQEQGVPTLCLHVPFSSAESDSDESWTEIDNGSPRGEKVAAQLPELTGLNESEKRPMDEVESATASDVEVEEEQATDAIQGEGEEDLKANMPSADQPVEAEASPTEGSQLDDISLKLEQCTLIAPAIVEIDGTATKEEEHETEEVFEETHDALEPQTASPINNVAPGLVTVVTPIAEAFIEEPASLTPTVGIDRLIEVMCSVNDEGSISGISDKQFFINMLTAQGNIAKLVDVAKHAAVQQAIATVAQAEQASEGSAQKASTTQLIKVLYQHPEVLNLLNQVPELEQVLLRVLRALKAREPERHAHQQATVEEPKVVHANVTCDGCSSDNELLNASVEAGCRNQQGEILGVHYKSVAIQDFDLCETCEATRRFQQRGGPFLKIVDPGTAPDVISYAREEIRRPLPAQVEVQAKPEEAAPVVVPKPEWSCKHWLKTFKTQHPNFRCDVCQQSQPTDTLLHGCRPCNFDVCHQCYVESNPATAPSAPTAVPKVAQAPAVPVVAAPAPPQAKFVSDVTLTDGCAVRPGERLNKTWRVRNSGGEKWLPGTRICHVGGDSFGGPLEGVEVPLAGPGEAVNISVPLVMPQQPGRYTSYWRLTTPHPQSAKFGHRFWVTVNVLPTAVSVAPVTMPPASAPMFRAPPPPPPTQLPGSPPVIARPPPPPAPVVRNEVEEIRPEFVSAVEQIVGFGFSDIEKIARIVAAVNGDVAEAVERLLAEA